MPQARLVHSSLPSLHWQRLQYSAAEPLTTAPWCATSCEFSVQSLKVTLSGNGVGEGVGAAVALARIMPL
jgi:hypothetical protein